VAQPNTTPRSQASRLGVQRVLHSGEIYLMGVLKSQQRKEEYRGHASNLPDKGGRRFVVWTLKEESLPGKKIKVEGEMVLSGPV